MRFIKLSLAIIAISVFAAACNTAGTDDISYSNPDLNVTAENDLASGEESYLARENLDLRAVGRLLEKADDAEEFEYLLNSDDSGVNNLDLNGDGYTDYISVAEYDDRDTNQRGFTLFDRFGADEIQEIARIIFARDSFNDRGARILLTGNEQLYGDDYYYETNWQDRSLAIADWAFNDRNDYYQSPYYYDNYPENYEVYRVVETPVYRTRIEQYYAEPVFIKTVNPAITQIKIKSKYKDKSVDKIFAKLAKPTKEQKEFLKNNPNRPEFVPVKNGKMKDVSTKAENKLEKKLDKEARKESKDFDKPLKEKNEKFDDRGKPDKIEKENGKSAKPDKRDKGGNGKNGGNKGGKGKGGKN